MSVEVIASGEFKAGLGTRTRTFVVERFYENSYLVLARMGEEVARIRYHFAEDAVRDGCRFLVENCAPAEVSE